ncbi:HAUS augmin-like complex subunit 2 [Plasmodiophora brassicae]|nr:hypothetical protein PBRA_003897 [Plasmodiophora brassicae]
MALPPGAAGAANPWCPGPGAGAHPIQALLDEYRLEAPPGDDAPACVRVGERVLESVRLSARHHQLTVEAERRRQYASLSETIDEKVISSRADAIVDLANYCRHLLAHRQALRACLGRVVTGDAICLEHKYHDAMRAFLMSVARFSVADLGAALSWAIEPNDPALDKVDEALGRIREAASSCDRLFDALSRVRSALIEYAALTTGRIA